MTMSETMIRVEKLPGCGAIVHGVRAAEACDGAIAIVRAAVAEHGVIFMDDQPLTQPEQIAFARRFGPIVINRYFPKSEQYPEVAKVEKTEEQVTNIGGGWHTDHSYDQEPAMGSLLLAIETPESGGDTMFADMYAAYDALPETQKRRLEGLRAIHGAAHIFGAAGAYAATDRADFTGHEETPTAVHPIVIRHPDSGKKVLYVNPIFTTGIEGMDEAEARPLLTELFMHAMQPQFTYRHSWRPGSLAFWDNRATWHYALNDYHGQRRLMHRITIAGGPLT
jgi:taurine dioxygenase